MLPTMDTNLIKVSYRAEVIVTHDGLLSKKQDVPSIWFPINILADPAGPLDPIVNTAATMSAQP